MKNLNKFALVAAMAFTFAACGNNANEAKPADEADKTEETTEETVPAEEAAPKVGEATAAGYGGDIKVTVHFGEDGKIESIDTDHTESEGVGADAIPELEKAVVEANGTEGVDNVSGATVTSEAFKAAVDEAIANAK
ncbi:FMN-binding protein [Anaerococcus sp. Marseille-Q7828]|uniref:FMN-binding protein n=1 Tax=Anaerococcus sp. Marseille-Q7828 TaxID=3036300 RepID=UPI0024AE4866|nr:FMN-binding protein [Anaerococcus sp. Marseille-Q7828]